MSVSNDKSRQTLAGVLGAAKARDIVMLCGGRITPVFLQIALESRRPQF
jgi:hypothetical protein